jgi:general stress protein YciG
LEIFLPKKGNDKMIREYLASIGRKGGKARAAKYDKAMLSKWAKKGGRPPKSKEGIKP